MLLSVVADGVPPLSYQWRHNGSDLFGANGPTLSLPNVQPPDEGAYAVVVSNASGSVTSAPAHLTIQSPPLIAAHPLAQVVNPGESATFTIFAGGSLPLHYQWFLNGISIPGATNDSYVCPNAFYTNAGNYVVTVSNDAGAAQSEPAELTVRPRFISRAVNNGVFTLSYEGTVGKSYQLEVSATLTNWTSLQVLSNATIQVQFQNTNVLGGSNTLYRLRQAP